MERIDVELARHEAEEERWLASRPVCDCCGEPIVDEYTWNIMGDHYCEYCAQEWFDNCRVSTEVYFDD